MKTEELKNDVLKDVLIHNQNVLVRANVKLGTFVLNGLTGNKTDKVSQSLSDAINNADKVIVKTNSKSEFNELVGRVVIVEDTCMPEIKNIETDPLDLQNVLVDFKHDFKPGDSINNGILYPINIYFTIKEYQIVMTKNKVDESN